MIITCFLLRFNFKYYPFTCLLGLYFIMFVSHGAFIAVAHHILLID